MHQPGNMESLLHWSHAWPQSACGTVRGRARRQARFWEAETHDVLVIGLSAFISVNMFTVEFILTGKLRAHIRAIVVPWSCITALCIHYVQRANNTSHADL